MSECNVVMLLIVATLLVILQLFCCESTNCQWDKTSDSSSGDVTVSSQRYKYARDNHSSTPPSCLNKDVCPFWQYCDENSRRCKPARIPHHILRTYQLDDSVSVLDCYCVTYNQSEQLAEIGSCIFNCENFKSDLIDVIYHTLPGNNFSKLNHMMCGKFNRDGPLCGKCENGSYPLAYSFNFTCVSCSHTESKLNLWKLLVYAFLPLTIFFFLVLFLQINANTSHLHGYVLYSQAIAMPAMSRVILLAARDKPILLTSARVFGTLYGIWNLDFLRSLNLGICLRTGTLATLTLDLIVGVYPIFLLIFSYVMIGLYDRNFRPLVFLWKPFRTVLGLFRENWNIRTSLIDAYATFFFLANVKILSVSYDLLVPVGVYQLNSSDPSGNVSVHLRLFYDASVFYFGPQHLPYAIVAIAVLVIYVILPTMIFIIYPFHLCQKIFTIFPFRFNNILHTFLDSFQGCYKDGTEPGTRDCRWFASIFFLIRFILFLIAAFTQGSMYFVMGAMVLVVTALLFINVQPYKSNFSRYSNISAFFFLYLALTYSVIAGIEMADVKKRELSTFFHIVFMIVCILPVFYMSLVIIHWVLIRRKFGLELVRRIYAYVIGGH